MSGTDDASGGEGSGKSVDADALKAKLGLTRRSRALNRPKTDDALVQKPSEEDVEAARKRAEDALAEAGTPVEAFDPLGQEFTPLPQKLPDDDGPVHAAAGPSKFGLKPVIIALVCVSVVAILLGQVLGRSLAHRAQLDSYATVVAEKLKYIQGAPSASGGKVLEEIAALQEVLASAVDDIDAVEQQKDPDPLVLENLFKTLVPKLARYEKEKVYLDAGRISQDMMVIYAEDPMLEALRFSTQTRLLYDTVSAIVGEATTLLRMEQPAGSTVRTILNEVEDREVEGLGKIPAGKGTWVKDTGRPAKVKLVDPTNPANTTEEWQMMVLTDDAKSEGDAIQVPTTKVIQLDLANIFAEQTHAIKLLRVDRFVTLTRQAHRIASGLKWKKVEASLEEWAAKAP